MNSIESKFAKECSIGMKWRIKEEVFREALATLNHEAIVSSVLKASSIPGLEYYLYLDSDAVDSSLNINLYLEFKMVKKVKATFTVSVKSANYQRIIVNHISDKTTDWGTICKEVLCARYQILDPKFKFFVDGYMEIELEGTLELVSGIKKKPSRALSLAQLLWKNDDEKDVAFVVEDQLVNVHKWVLTANSPVFKAEMESGMKEAQEKKITVTDFSVEIVKIFVDYCYERDIRNDVNEGNASELLHFSDKYDVEPLHNLVQNFLTDKLAEENVCKLANMSITSNAKELRECCVCFLMKYVGQCAVIDGFSTVDKEITSEIGRRCFLSFSD
uniref:BTB domain-containing protein n=1 Tax=Panagrolaimus davidi TaxID=227884 RepID=A0A914QUV1_9BILA